MAGEGGGVSSRGGRHRGVGFGGRQGGGAAGGATAAVVAAAAVAAVENGEAGGFGGAGGVRGGAEMEGSWEVSSLYANNPAHFCWKIGGCTL